MNHHNIPRQKRFLFLEAVAILVAMLALLIFSGLHIVGAAGLALILAVFIFIGVTLAHRRSPVRLANAVQLDRGQAGELYRTVDTISQNAGLEHAPTLYLLPASIMNAASLGNRERPMIAVTPPVLQQLTQRELEGVLAHEISHIRNNDLVYYRFVEAVRIVTVTLSRIGWFMIILYFPVLMFGSASIPLSLLAILIAAPVGSVLLQLALSRSREFNADLTAVELTNDPEALASALEKIDNVGRSLVNQLFPVPQRHESSIFRTHPATEERARRLRALARNR